jgi:hypothetical protein
MKNRLAAAFFRFLATGSHFKLTAMMLQAEEIQTSFVEQASSLEANCSR